MDDLHGFKTLEQLTASLAFFYRQAADVRFRQREYFATKREMQTEKARALSECKKAETEFRPVAERLAMWAEACPPENNALKNARIFGGTAARAMLKMLHLQQVYYSGRTDAALDAAKKAEKTASNALKALKIAFSFD